MAVLGINSRAAFLIHFSLTPLRNQLFPTFLKGDVVARIDAENGHRRVTRRCSRIIVKKTRGIPTDYLRAPPDTIENDREPHEVSGSRADHDAVFG